MNNLVADNKKSMKAMYKRYLLKEQGFDEDVVNSMTISELKETYEYYHE